MSYKWLHVQSAVGPFFLDTNPKTAFFNDLTITSSLRSVVQVVMGHFTVFQSHGLSGWLVPKVMKSCLHFSKLWPKYCRYLFSRHCVVSGSVWGCIHISASEHDTHSIVCFSTANELFILFVWTCVCVCVESWLSQCNKYSYHWHKNVFNVFIFFQLLYYKKHLNF